MKHILKIAATKPAVMVLTGLFFAFLGTTSCKKDPIAPPDEPIVPSTLEKKILDFYIPFKYVVIDEVKHQVVIYESEDLEQVTPTIEVSEGVTIQPASGVKFDENTPPTYTLTAADGSKQQYDLIVCSVDWEYMELLSGGFSITRMGQFKEPWSAISQNGILTLHFGKNTESSIDIYINSPIAQSLEKQFTIGNYSPANVPAGKAGATFVYRENGVLKTFASPQEGTLVIQEYDAVKSTISGSFSQLKYAGNGTSSQGSTILSGTFEHLPLQLK